MTEPVASAREQLRALAGDPAFAQPWGDFSFGRDDRPAAVLVLFGVLDARRADRDAPAVSRDLDVLLLSRATTLRSHAGQVAFPGGRIDPGDAGPVEAALREAVEETGLDPTGVEVLGTLPEVPLPYSLHRVTPVLGWWARPTPVRVVDEGESSSVFRAPVAELLDPANRYTTRLRRDEAEHRGPAWLLQIDGQERLVWGFTAIILDTLFTRLGWTEPWDPERVIDL
ncbi:NUDIX hydrolase [Microbacterium sediminis]|uniref:Coenzyme A pyrophosphatase n=1 Tax=Microbacterium sediminis TaxID=904291 RepID=A0A1B9NF24_9MICO|nr:CoA pyrophosphatase [Microbacterium sediminis]OCG75199.1 coenzyme A pyrophosphatase [Microbacterium sediminis]QBR74219.1 CoA pyrophosphatase [Microbacterium sediminis]